MVCLSWLLEYVHCRKKSQVNASIHKTDALEHVTAGAGSASLSATSPWCRRPPRRASRVRASYSPRYTAALAASPFCLLRFSMLRQA